MKHETIGDLLRRLPLDERGWVVVDHWEADPCAIGIAHSRAPRRLVYVSTFGKNAHRYFYACEEPSGPEATDYRTTATVKDASFEELLEALERHLR